MSWFRQDRVREARVMVIGCGALGNEVLKNLALFGVGHLVLVDFDRVEESNLSRSVLFRTGDARQGRYKVEAARQRLLELNPGLDIQTICGDIAYDVGLGLIRRMDVLVGCVDNRWARYCINRLAMRAGKPWVDGGIEALEGTARVFIPGRNCYACNLGPEGLKEMQRRFSCAHTIRMNEAAGRVPTTPVVASVIGAVEAQEALKLIANGDNGEGELTSLCGRMFCYEGQHLTTRTVAFRAYDEDCPVHEEWTPVRESTLNNRMTVGEVLAELRNMLHDEHIRISLTGDCFADKLIRKDDDQAIEVMVPKHLVKGEMLKGKGERLEDYFVNEYYELDERFPYPGLTLAQVGIPPQDVLRVHTAKSDCFVELKQ